MTVGPLTSSRLNRISNTMAALTLAYTPRTAAEAATVDWAKVATFSAAGIGTGSAGAPFDVVVRGDNNTWFSQIAGYGNEPSWTRTDMRVINLMAPTSPAKYSGPTPKVTSPDARFESDYTYLGSVIGDPNRGIYMQSPYYHSRYEEHGAEAPDAFATPAPYLLAAESDLVRAEALIRTNGDLALAATLINNTRVGRGKLAPMTAASGSAALLKAIEYERDVELTNTNGFALFIRRHVDGLQPGTVKHLPIPAKELETLSMPIYTFGGPGKEMFLGTVGSGVMASRGFTFGEPSAELLLPTGDQMTLHFPRRSTNLRGASRQ
jgi:hypothetical protein